ncbi:hypothetical protein ACFX11_013315 [Malus domestica]
MSPEQHVIIHQQFLLPGEVISLQAHNVGMAELPQHRHVLLELSLPANLSIIEPLNRHHIAIVENRFVRHPEPAFPQHLRGGIGQVLELETLHSFEGHHPAQLEHGLAGVGARPVHDLLIFELPL